MKPPRDFIVPQKVGKKELYRIFNNPTFFADIVRRTTQRVDVFEGLASKECNQPPGTTSHVYDWYEYDEKRDQAHLLATVHMFKKPDGTIGASGRHDPIILVVDGVVLTDP